MKTIDEVGEISIPIDTVRVLVFDPTMEHMLVTQFKTGNNKGMHDAISGPILIDISLPSMAVMYMEHIAGVKPDHLQVLGKLVTLQYGDVTQSIHAFYAVLKPEFSFRPPSDNDEFPHAILYLETDEYNLYWVNIKEFHLTDASNRTVIGLGSLAFLIELARRTQETISIEKNTPVHVFNKKDK